MAGKCVICGKSREKLLESRGHPGKQICLQCFNELLFNLKTIEEELDPLADALGRGLSSVEMK